MKRPLRLARALVVAAAIATALSTGSGTANAITWDFVPATDPTDVSAGTSTLAFVSGGVSLTVTGWALDSANDTAYTAATLWRRNEGANDEGISVCNSGDTCTDGAQSEIDNHGALFDVIRLNLTDLTPLILQSVKLSSVDGTNDKFKIFGSNATNPDLTSLSVTLLASGGPTGNPNPIIPLSGTWTFLYVTTDPAFPQGTGGGDYLLNNLVATPVPEPGTLLLLGSGLAGLGFLGRRRKRKGSQFTAESNL